MDIWDFSEVFPLNGQDLDLMHWFNFFAGNSFGFYVEWNRYNPDTLDSSILGK